MKIINYIFLLITCLSAHAALVKDILIERATAKAHQAYEQKEFGQSQNLLESVLPNAIDNDQLLFNAGAAAYKKENFQDALTYFTQAVEYATNTTIKKRALFNSANTHVQLKQLEQALDAYTKVLEIDPDDKKAAHNKEIIEKLLEQQKQEQEKKDQDSQNQEDQEQDSTNQDKDDNDSQNQDSKDQDPKSQQDENQEQKDNSSNESDQEDDKTDTNNRDQERDTQDQDQERSDKTDNKEGDREQKPNNEANKKHGDRKQDPAQREHERKKQQDKQKSNDSHAQSPQQNEQSTVSEQKPAQQALREKDTVNAQEEQMGIAQEAIDERLNEQERRLLELVKEADSAVQKALVRGQIDQLPPAYGKNW